MRPIKTLRRVVKNIDRVEDLVAAAARLQEAADNLATDLNERLDRLVVTTKLDQLRRVQRFVLPHKDGKDSPHLTKERPRSGDIELIERYSHDWQVNADSYVKTLPNLRQAARRLLQVLEHTNNSYGISDDELRRLQAVEHEVTCLARQPLFFTEMFHGVTQLSDGRFEPLDVSDAEHLRADGLLGVEDRRALCEIYERLIVNSRSTIRVAEIGAAAGRGSTSIAGEYIKRAGGTLYCIDPWAGRWYFAFLTNIRIFALEGTVIPIRSPSVAAAALFDDGSLDAVFIDGSHMYPDVLADIDTYFPKIRKDGWIFGHDLYDIPSRFDRNELLSIATVNNADANYMNIYGEIERINVHPGVILAIQDRFGDDIELFGHGSVVWAKQV